MLDRSSGAFFVGLCLAVAVGSAVALGLPALAAPGAAGSGSDFQAARFGEVLDPAGQEAWEGYFWWAVGFGMADAVWRYASTQPYQPGSWRYWGGMAVAAGLGGTVGAFSGGYASVVQAAGPLSRWASAALRVYGYARTKALNEAIRLGQSSYRWP